MFCVAFRERTQESTTVKCISVFQYWYLGKERSHLINLTLFIFSTRLNYTWMFVVLLRKWSFNYSVRYPLLLSVKIYRWMYYRYYKFGVMRKRGVTYTRRVALQINRCNAMMQSMEFAPVSEYQLPSSFLTWTRESTNQPEISNNHFWSKKSRRTSIGWKSQLHCSLYIEIKEPVSFDILFNYIIYQGIQHSGKLSYVSWSYACSPRLR